MPWHCHGIAVALSWRTPSASKKVLARGVGQGFAVTLSWLRHGNVGAEKKNSNLPEQCQSNAKKKLKKKEADNYIVYVGIAKSLPK